MLSGCQFLCEEYGAKNQTLKFILIKNIPSPKGKNNKTAKGNIRKMRKCKVNETKRNMCTRLKKP